MEYTENRAKEQPFINLLCQNSVCTIEESRKMVSCKVPTNPGQHFASQTGKFPELD
jgi:hypothetical protein